MFRIFLVAVFLSSVLMAAIELTPQQKSWIEKKRVVNICADPNWMPFEKIDKDGEYIGIIADYQRLIYTKAALHFKVLKTKNFTQSKAYLAKGLCDAISADVPTERNREHFLVSKPFFFSPRVFVTHVDTPWVSDLSYLFPKNNKIGVVKSTPAKEILKKLYQDKVDIVEFKDSKTALKALSSKRVIAFVNVMPNVAYTIQKNGFLDVKISGYMSKDVELSIIVNKNLPILVDILNKSIDQITQKERLTIFSRWIKVEFEEGSNYKKYLLIIAVLLLIAIATSIISVLLKKKVSKEVEKNRQQQMMMMQQSRLAQMGEMISMIAHQWRQPLNNLSLINQLIINKYRQNKLDDDFMEYFKNRSKDQIDYMSTTIDDFRNFFQKEDQKVAFDLNDIVSEMLNMLEVIFKNSEITLHYHHNEHYKVYGYPKAFAQALINIINNAKDALNEQNSSDKHISIELLSQDDRVFVTIKDNAGGIPDEIIKKIFDPYFSTKGQLGTGLGLYMSKMIIEKMDGAIEVVNDDEGARFSISFKRHSKE
jgi:signal transduction histidine kinase